MKTLIVDMYIIENALDALRIAANNLDSRKRETAADRQIDFAERLLRWVIVDGHDESKRPKWIPEKDGKL